MPEHRVAVVTDSTASLPEHLAREAGIVVVPLQVFIDGRGTLADGALPGSELARELRAGTRATTSQPTPEAFEEVYSRLADEGATAVVSVHLSGELSGTVRSAAEAGARAGVPVHVVDTRSVALGTGFAALAAAQVAASTGDADAAVAAARDVAERSAVVFAVQDLGYLHRGGRIGATKLLVGSVLGARPVLRVSGGRIGVAETVRGASRASRRLAELLVEAARDLGPAPVRAAVLHLDAAPAADELAGLVTGQLAAAGLELDDLVLTELTAVVGVHTGPGVLGVVVAPLPRSP